MSWNGSVITGPALNGSAITGPALLFHDEIQHLNDTQSQHFSTVLIRMPGLLVCSSPSSAGVAWLFADSTPVPDAPAMAAAVTGFQQTRHAGNTSVAVLSRSLTQQGAPQVHDTSGRSNGLWMCRLNNTNQSTAGKVAVIGLYHRNNSSGTSSGILRSAATMLIRSRTDFMGSTPFFALIGKTTGGPPTSFLWTKDGVPLTSASSINIAIAPVLQNDVFRYRDAIYESTLKVSGRQPGLYEYQARNRISGTLKDAILIEGA